MSLEPQIGDVVVATRVRWSRPSNGPWPGFASGSVSVLRVIRAPADTHRYYLDSSEGAVNLPGRVYGWADEIRHPTPEELAAYQLSRGAQ